MYQRKLHVDFETYSGTDLSDCGSYKYCRDPEFQILLMAWSFDDEQEQVWDYFSGEPFPQDVLDAFYDKTVEKMAHNAAFEMDCIEATWGRTLSAIDWTCTMVKCAMLGLPMALDAVSSVLNLKDAKQKSGKTLIRKFCIPTKPHKDDGRTRNLPEHYPEDWATFKEYCIFDVKAEKEICKKTAFYTIPPFERELWALDRKINQTGVPVDREFVESLIALVEHNKELMFTEMIADYGIENPNSDAQIKAWIKNFLELPEDVKLVMNKDNLSDEIKYCEAPEVKRVMEIRGELNKTSTAKYYAMRDMMTADNRIRGMHQYCGAGRTWRWAGRKVQPQNLPKNSEEYFGKDMEIMDKVRQWAKNRDIEGLSFFYDNLPNVYSQLLRSAFHAEEGSRFIVSDFSSIEAVVTAWMASEQWRLDSFIAKEDIYKVSYSKMFGIDISEVTKNQRSQGKILELSMGFGGSVGAIDKMDKKKEIPDKLRPKVVKLWREASPKIKQLWADLNKAAIAAIRTGEKQIVQQGIEFFFRKNCLWTRLPSGRLLCYFGAYVGQGKMKLKKEFKFSLKKQNILKYRFVKDRATKKFLLTYEKVIDQVFYYGMDQTTKQWRKMSIYGGKFCENICQSIARDCLAVKMLLLDKAGYRIVMHVHDEDVSEMEYGKGSLEEVNHIMSLPIEWAPGLPLRAAGFETEFYKKD